ncbi:hypothetical protein BDV28DRAFT_100977 [Aspergillus coremiiformis]|uniref:Uncharacterized protein n=1 Tax=Aspergillus coremiiformis TaxID=138285 RepID=A0A5N6YRX0_9EURO|nr:hypothetical protein BDV28DRAFT_100977 [Aspergillus coremiiformis]
MNGVIVQAPTFVPGLKVYRAGFHEFMAQRLFGLSSFGQGSWVFSGKLCGRYSSSTILQHAGLLFIFFPSSFIVMYSCPMFIYTDFENTMFAINIYPNVH